MPGVLVGSVERFGSRLTRGERATIVAFGSSSTFGAGATSVETSYPARLEALLRARFPRTTLRVVNRGLNGDDMGGMLRRLRRDVIDHAPDLVLWQLGTNDLLGDSPIRQVEQQIRQGLARFAKTRADIVLIDLQYSPAVLEKRNAEHMVDTIAGIARKNGVGLFRRFALMRRWHKGAHLPFRAFLTEDNLHMNDWGYDCLARQIAAAIGDAA
jgi:acyl-CoA thioesterase-1